MTIPTLPAININQYYASTTIPAFNDTLSGFTNPPTCKARSCTSSHPNVVWDNASQLFTVQTLGTLDVRGIFTVTLTCSLTSFTAVAAASQTFQLTISKDCTTNNSMILPTLPALTIDQNYVSSSIIAFEDVVSGTTVPPACLARECTSNHPNVIWNNAS